MFRHLMITNKFLKTLKAIETSLQADKETDNAFAEQVAADILRFTQLRNNLIATCVAFIAFITASALFFVGIFIDHHLPHTIGFSLNLIGSIILIPIARGYLIKSCYILVLIVSALALLNMHF